MNSLPGMFYKGRSGQNKEKRGMKGMKKYLTIISKGIAIILGGILLGAVLITLAYCVPVNGQLRQESYATLESEGWYPAIPNVTASKDEHFHSYLPGVLDGSSDRVMLYTAGNEIAENPLTAAMRSYNAYRDEDYSYYWHGYVVVLRPLMYFFSYTEIRMLNALGQIALLVALAVLISKKCGRAHGVMLLTSYALLMPMAMGFALHFSGVFYIAGAACFILLKKQSYLEKNSRYLYLFVVTGMLTGYVDLLSNPLLTWGILTIWWLIVCEKNGSRLSYLGRVVSTGISWVCGYGLMWAAKWLIGSIILKENILQAAIDEVYLRAGSSVESAYGITERLDALYKNWKHYSYKIYFLILALWLAWIVVRSIRKGWKSTNKCPAFFLTGFSSVVWYFVLANHTGGHHFFTYRIFGISILAFMAMALEVLQPGGAISQAMDKQDCGKAKRALLTMAGWAVIAVASVVPMKMAREELSVINGDAPVTSVILEQGAVAECTFIPSFSEITRMGFGMTSEGTQGEYVITLAEKGAGELYQEIVPIDAEDTTPYKSIPVDWKLEAGKEYDLRLEARGTDGAVSVVVTEPNYLPLSEYRYLWVGGIPQDGQLLAGLTYWALPISRAMQLFLLLTWSAVLAAIAVTVQSLIGKNSTRKN